jgi:uncharacterized protein YoxC
VVRNPSAAPVKKLVEIEDVIESQQELIEKEITEKLQSNEIEVEHQMLALFAKAGKYLFLGVVLPPYILLYSIPKWVVADAIPKVINKISEGIESIKNALAYPFRVFSNPVPKPLQVEKVEDQKGFDLVAMARNGVYSLGQKFFHPFYQATMWLTNGIASVGAALLNFAGKALDGMGNSANHLKNTFLEMIDKARHGIKNAGNAFNQSFIQPCLHWLVGKVDVFMRVTKKIGAGTLRLAKEVLKQTLRTLQHPIEVLREFRAGVITRTMAVGTFVRRKTKEWLEPKLQFVQATMSTINQNIRKAARKVQDKAEKIKQKVQEAVATILQQAQNIISSVWFVPYIFQQITPEWLIRWAQPKMAFMKRVGVYAAKVGQFVAVHMVRWGNTILSPFRSFAERSKHFLLKIRDQAGQAFQRFRERTKAIPKKIKVFGMYCGNQAKKFLKRGFYGIRVVFAWIRVLGRLWMQLVKELAQEIGYLFRY